VEELCQDAYANSCKNDLLRSRYNSGFGWVASHSIDFGDAGALMSESRNSQQIDLRTLIGHATAVRAEGKLEEVYQLFGKHNVAFIAVLENGRLLGMCSRWQIGMLLGSRYGFSLYSQKPIRDHLLPQALRVSVQSPIASVLEQVASRSDEAFYDDVAACGRAGLIPWNGLHPDARAAPASVFAREH
jgi:hypothetical protein